MLDNKNIQKIFSLGDIRKKQLLGEVPERTRETYREFGYFGGGGDQFQGFTTISRLDYSNDTQTSSRKGSLLVGTTFAGYFGNSNFGYIGGGVLFYQGVSSIYRLNYSNDTTNTTKVGSITGTGGGDGVIGLGNQNFGYFGGASQGLLPKTSIVSRLNYSTDTDNTVIRGPLSQPKNGCLSSSNPNFGWFVGGITNVAANTTHVDRINYSNDAIIASIRGNLQVGRHGADGGTGNSNFGYFAKHVYSSLERIAYSNDTTLASPRAILISSIAFRAATGNSNFGYFSGGSTPSPNVSIIQRIDYSNDTTVALVRGPMTFNTALHAATSSSSFGGSPNSSFASNFTFPTVPNAGYFGGGSDAISNLATIDKVDYANDTATASVRSALSSAKQQIAATGNGSFGYFGGGSPGPVSTVDRLEYSSDTQNAVVRGPLSVGRHYAYSTSNNDFGYIGGRDPAGGTDIDRIDFSNDNATASVRGPLTTNKRNAAGAGNRNFGYFAAGYPIQSGVDRIDYSNDLATALTRGPLSASKYNASATGNSNFGYFGGGNVSVATNYRSIVDRIDYSNDTQTAVIRGSLSVPKSFAGATGNSNFGYFGGGQLEPISTVDRINYSNDTAIASIRGPLSTAKSSLAATSPLAYGGAPIYFTNPLPEVLQKQIIFNDANTLDLPFKRVLGSFGYFGGGNASSGSPSVWYSSIERIDYSNDLTTPLIRGFLSVSRLSLAGVGNKNYGWYGIGGRVFSVKYSTIDRIDYSNDNVVCSFRCTASPQYYEQGSVTNDYYGWWFGGGDGAVSFVQRINYSSDTSTASNRGFLNQGSDCISGTSNDNYGWASGGGNGGGGFGGNGPYLSRIERINFSNDTVKQSRRGNLITARCASGSFGNQNYGWIFSGRNGISSSTSTIERIDYSNDLSNIITRSNVSVARSGGTSSGNNNYGWFSGGAPHSYPSGPVYSIVDRLDFSNDTTNSSTRNSLTTNRTAAFSSTNAASS